MATLSKERDRYRCQFVYAKKRYTIRLGRVTKRSALDVKDKVERLIYLAAAGETPDESIGRWLADCDDRVRNVLGAAGLCNSRPVQTVGDLAGYMMSRSRTLKPSTKESYQTALDQFVGFIGDGHRIQAVTRGDIEDYRTHLRSAGYAPTTITTKLMKVRQLFECAVENRWLSQNPARGMKGWHNVNPKNQVFVDKETVDRVLEEVRDVEVRAAIVFARWGGVRIPSEIAGMTWEDVVWSKEVIHIKSPKTEHHPGRDSRVIPIFPELRPVLDELWSTAKDGEQYLFPVLRAMPRSSVGGLLRKYIKRSGVTPWPRAFHQLRASRETELVERFPIQVVCAWIGNTPDIALKHYLRVTDDHFQKATQNPTHEIATNLKSDAESDARKDCQSSH